MRNNLLNYFRFVLLLLVYLGVSWAEAQTVATINARDMQKTTGGNITIAGVSAYNIWSNGSISATFNAAATGSYTIQIQAYGQSAGGVQANMRVSVDGVVLKNFSVAAGVFKTYSLTTNLNQGARKIAIAFTNDAIVAGQDRNLIVSKMTVVSNIVAAPATGTSGGTTSGSTSGSTNVTTQVGIASTSISAASVQQGQTQSTKLVLGSATGISNLLVDIRIYNSDTNQMVVRKGFEGVNIVANGSATLQYDYQFPANQALGNYDIRVGVWSSDYSKTYLYEYRNQFKVIAPVVVVQPAPVVTQPAPVLTGVAVTSSSVSKNPLIAGDIQSAQVVLGAGSNYSNLIVDIRIYNSDSGTMLIRKGFDGINIGAGSSVTLKYDYPSSLNLAAGNYEVRVGVWSGDWMTTYLYETRNKFSVVASATSSPVTTPTTPTSPAPTTPTNPPYTPVTGNYPLANAKLFINPWTGANFNRNYCAAMPKIADNSIAIWMAGGQDYASDARDMNFMFDEAAKQGGAVPTFVVYNIPNRDCGYYSAGGVSAQQYPGFVDNIARTIGSRKAIVILEPDALAGVADTTCMQQSGIDERIALIRNAVYAFKSLAPNTAVYIDAGNASWVQPGIMANLLRQAGIDRADGFAINVSNFIATNINIDYGTQISQQTGGKHFVIDTSRNGNGAGDTWCNPAGRALGPRPQGFSSGLVDAYLWVKPPGDSDGSCNGAPGAGAFMPDYACGLAERAAW